jgi:hypothetical protein
MESLCTPTESGREAFQERAAIVESETGWPKSIAKGNARRMIGERA